MIELSKIEIENRIAELDKLLKDQRDSILAEASSVLDSDISVHMFHGIIGSKNNLFANVATHQYTSVEAFQAIWAEKMLQYYEPYRKYWHKEEELPRILRLYNNEIIRNYILLFQERNFYRWYNERIRRKPNEPLTALWFGDKLVFGLYVALVFESDETYRFKVRQVRKVTYEYWTIGNVLGVGGFVNAENGKLYVIKSVDDILNFYEHIVYSSSSSPYEKAIYTRYIDYLKESDDVTAEPFLIPELRYAGRDREHKYRLDFAICNPYTFEFIGFELSPASTHMAIAKMKDKTQTKVNEELSQKWEKECDKRNEYFNQYGITTITFTDSDLQDMDACFEKMKYYLQKRVYTPQPLQTSINKINTYLEENLNA